MLRLAEASDAPRVAALHAASWRSAYAGIYDAAYLAGPVEQERSVTWTKRLTEPAPNQHVLLTEQEGVLTGFASLYLDHDPVWGAKVDNLHAHPERRGQGIGRVLLAASAALLREKRPGQAIYLWVLEANHPATAFYLRMGGKPSGTSWTQQPDGQTLPRVRMAWPADHEWR